MTRRFVLQSRQTVGVADFAAEMNAEQLAVATAEGGPMLVVAGAGSGKTRALIYRVAYLVRAGVDPSRIMLVTFTNRAAREMLSRADLIVKGETRHIWGGTFHHLANRVLRKYGPKLGIASDYTILDREDASDLLKSCVPEAGVAIEKKRFPQKRVLMEIASFAQNTLETLEQLLTRRYPMFLEQCDDIRRVLELYAVRKRERQFLDYDDLLGAWLLLLKEHADIRDKLAQQFQHILVDEYQDTNAIQGAIVDILGAAHRNVCVVGDDSQSIYSFRGATFENIIGFKTRYPDAREYRLETNYRSTPEILTLANASIAVNTRRLPKELRAVRAPGLKPAIVSLYDGLVQARFIAEYVLHLLDQGRKLNDMAVLYRSHWNSMEIQLEFQRRNIPFRVRGGLRFFEQAHIKDVLAHLRIVLNPRDELAWLRTLQMIPKVGGALSQRLWRHIDATNDPVAAAAEAQSETLLPTPARPFFKQFAKLLQEIVKVNSPADMIETVMERHYKNYLSSHYEHASLRKEDIKGMQSFAGQYNSVEAFLADVALAGDFSGETVVTGPEEQEFVTLSTVHQAKGLEWPVVFIPWLSDGRFPTDFCINTREDEEEERRVFHVAVTRAKDELYLSVPQFLRRRSQELIMMKPSRFITELPEGLIEPMVVEEGLPHVIVGEKVVDADAKPLATELPQGKTELPEARTPTRGARRKGAKEHPRA